MTDLLGTGGWQIQPFCLDENSSEAKTVGLLQECYVLARQYRLTKVEVSDITAGEMLFRPLKEFMTSSGAIPTQCVTTVGDDGTSVEKCTTPSECETRKVLGTLEPVQPAV